MKTEGKAAWACLRDGVEASLMHREKRNPGGGGGCMGWEDPRFFICKKGNMFYLPGWT